MGISDRDYARAGRGGSRPAGMGAIGPLAVNTWIIVINVLVFLIGLAFMRDGVPVLQAISLSAASKDPAIMGAEGEYWVRSGERVPPEYIHRVGVEMLRPVIDRVSGEQVGFAAYRVMDPLSAYGHFSTALGFQRIEVWRLVTFQFLHANLIHIFFNMFGLWIFGGTVERQLGRKKYLAFYLVCGIFGALMYLLLNFLGAVLGLRLPGVLFHDTHVPLVGASAGVFGVIVACAAINPKETIPLFGRVSIKLPWLAYGYVALAVLNLLRRGENAGGDAAHVGGALAGAFFIRRQYLLRDFFDVFKDSRLTPDAAPGPDARSRGLSAEEAAEFQKMREIVRSIGTAGLSESELARFEEWSRRAGGE